MRAARNAALAGTVAVPVAYLLLPLGGRAVLFAVTGMVSVAVAAVAVRVHRPVGRCGWCLLTAGLAAFVVVDTIWSAADLGIVGLPGGHLLDWLYLAGYLPLLAGLLVVVRTVLPAGSRGLLLDAAVFGTAAYAVMERLAMPGLVARAGAAGVTFALFVVADVVLATGMVGLLFLVVARTRATSVLLLAASILTLLLADTVYAATTAGGDYASGSAIDAVWLVSYLLFAAGAADTSMRVLGQCAERARSEAGRVRVALIGVAAVVGPSLLLPVHGARQAAGVVVSSVVFATVIVARLHALLAEQRATHRALARSEQRFEALVRNSEEVIAVVDPDVRLVYANPAAEHVFGYAASEMVGMPMLDLIHRDDLPAVLASLDRTLSSSSGEPSPLLEYRVRDARGRWRWLESTGTNLLADPAVRGIVVNARETTERKQAEFALSYQATHDALTDLPNRSLLLDRLEHALHRSRRTGRDVAVLFCDLDRFKIVNDSLGHDVGDDLLLEVSRRLVSAVRPSDTVARLGSDDFVVVREDVSCVGEAVATAERLRHAVAEPLVVRGHRVFPSMSVGVATGGARTRPGVLVRDADAALYAAKRAGRNRVEVFDDGVHEQVLADHFVEVGLHEALRDGRLVVHYQPVLDVVVGEVVGVEALVRWDHPDRGLLPPTAFIRVAEETGLIGAVGAHVLRTACDDLARWERDALLPQRFHVAVNLSPQQLADHGLATQVRHVLGSTGVAPSRLVLEVTETVILDGGNGSVGVMDELRRLGVRIALDDFATGFSSLSYVKRFPFDMLKIDREFIERCDTQPADAEMVRAIVAMADAFGADAVAEGVESEAQLAAVKALGCRFAQGFLVAPPLPEDGLVAYLRRRRAGTEVAA